MLIMKKSLSPVARLAGFALVLTVVLAGSFGVARALAPQGLADESAGNHPSMNMNMAGGGDHAADSDADKSSALVPGLAVSEAGYRLVPDGTTFESGSSRPFQFRLLGPDGLPVVRYNQLHERELHLIVVRRDLTGFQHVHPARAPDGRWAISLDLQTGGTWRAFADFSPTGGPAQLTLGVDLQVAGSFTIGTSPTAAATPDPRMAVSFDRRGDVIQVNVQRDGTGIQPEPYLGARGHLVALRVGDLAYLHVHPEAGDGLAVGFQAHLPTPGQYALFFDYQVEGVVHTAVTTVEQA